MSRERNNINQRTRNQRRISFMELDGKQQINTHASLREQRLNNLSKPTPQAHSQR